MSLYSVSRPKLCFMVQSIGASQLTFTLMMRAMEHAGLDVSFAFEKLDKPAHASISSYFHSSDCYGYDGPVIATNLVSAKKLIRFPSPKPKFFFCDDIEWIRFPQKQYESLEAVYRNQNLTLLARCNDHARLIESAWNVKVDNVIENYNFFTKNFLDYLEMKKQNAGIFTEPKIEYKSILEYI